jgi:hypothetical protein
VKETKVVGSQVPFHMGELHPYLFKNNSFDDIFVVLESVLQFDIQHVCPVSLI